MSDALLRWLLIEMVKAHKSWRGVERSLRERGVSQDGAQFWRGEFIGYKCVFRELTSMDWESIDVLVRALESWDP